LAAKTRLGGKGAHVPSGTLSLGMTFVLACASAAFFLFLRCHGTGRPFGPNSRPWALLVIVVTGLLSTAIGFASVIILSRLPFASLGLGLVAPSGLWLSEIRSKRDERRGLGFDLSTLWLTRLLARLQEGMAEDRIAWCEQRIDEEWSTDELGMAARFYQEYLRERMSPEERRRSRIYAQLSAIENRLTVVQLIENSSGKTKIAAALQGSRATKDARYSGHLGDLGKMADILRHDAERELIRLLGFAYSAGYYRMPVFTRREARSARPAVAA
jgi:hypothetical protein